MKYDNIIIGGGLSGLVCGIESARSGRKTAIVSAGQSALHFWSGSFEFLCNEDSRIVIDHPLERAERLDESHPYRKIGVSNVSKLLDRVLPLLREAGIKVNGSLERNHYRLTPFGYSRPAWLTLDEYLSFQSPSELKGKRAAIVNIYSYLDFYPRFLALGLSKLDVECVTASVNVPQLDILRKSTTEMRATNMSRFLTDSAVDDLAREVNRVSSDCDMVIMPAVLGIFDDEPVNRLRRGVDRPVFFVATTPASETGVRCQLSLRDYFTSLGGTYMPGDTVVGGEISDGRIRKIYTSNFGSIPLIAENYVICTGSFFGHGLIANMETIYEPVFGLDLNAPDDRTEWYDKNFYASQPYMGYGVVTDEKFRPMKEGKVIENLYATGALLSGFNALKEGSGAGITLATALHAASCITR